MIKIHNIHIGDKYELSQLSEDWAIVHACKTSHQQKLGYAKPPVGESYYIEFRDGNHLYLNWVDEPTGRYYQTDTFKKALDFIDEYVGCKNIFIHCDQGQSRSPVLGMVYLAKRTDYLEDDFQKALDKFSEEYPNFQPSGIIKFVQLNWENIK